MDENEIYVICSRSASCDAEMLGSKEPLYRCVSCVKSDADEGSSLAADVVFHSAMEAIAHLKKHQISAEELEAAANRIDFLAINSPRAFRKLRAEAGPIIDRILESRRK